MGKAGDGAKRRYWTNLIRQHSKSGEKVTAFCARSGVSVHQFHWWRRTLRERNGQPMSGTRRKPLAGDRGASKPLTDSQSFVPIRLPLSLAAPIEVVHPRGFVVRVPAVFDPRVLRRVLAALDPTAATAVEM